MIHAMNRREAMLSQAREYGLFVGGVAVCGSSLRVRVSWQAFAGGFDEWRDSRKKFVRTRSKTADDSRNFVGLPGNTKTMVTKCLRILTLPLELVGVTSRKEHSFKSTNQTTNLIQSI